MVCVENQGSHVFIDYTEFFVEENKTGQFILNVLKNAVAKSPAREVHSHVEEFDGTVSPPGFAAVVLLDESHVSAHCYSDRGLLAIDCFTCGKTDPNIIADFIHASLTELIPSIKLMNREYHKRFLNGE